MIYVGVPSSPVDTVRGSREELIQRLREAGETEAAMRLTTDEWAHGVRVDDTLYVVTDTPVETS